MKPGGDGESSGVFCGRGRTSTAIAGDMHNAACGAASGVTGVYLLVALSALPCK